MDHDPQSGQPHFPATISSGDSGHFAERSPRQNDLKFYQDELHQKREFITQKRESAYEFWCRPAFEEGINFWFEGGPKLFYSDNHLGMTAGIHLTYNPQADTDITDSTAFSGVMLNSCAVTFRSTKITTRRDRPTRCNIR